MQLVWLLGSVNSLLMDPVGMFEPEPEAGDRWRWAVGGVVVVGARALLDARDLRPAADLLVAAAGVAFVLGIAALLRLVR
jgi:hypothetical protein